MIVGTVVGVAQTSLKRMLAYSSIAHGGYLLLGIIAGNDVGKAAILYYLAAYALTNLGAFGIIALLGTRDRANDDLRDYAGLWHSHPALAALMTMFLLSLGGFPPTAGFIAKWYVFSAAVGAGYYGLAIIGVLSSVVSVFFYLRIVVMMYMSERDARPVPPPVTGVAMAGLALSLAGVLYSACCRRACSTGRRRRSGRSSRDEGHEGSALLRRHSSHPSRGGRGPAGVP